MAYLQSRKVIYQIFPYLEPYCGMQEGKSWFQLAMRPARPVIACLPSSVRPRKWLHIFCSEEWRHYQSPPRVPPYLDCPGYLDSYFTSLKFVYICSESVQGKSLSFNPISYHHLLNRNLLLCRFRTYIIPTFRTFVK